MHHQGAVLKQKGVVLNRFVRTTEIELGVLSADIFSGNVNELNSLLLGEAVKGGVQVL